MDALCREFVIGLIYGVRIELYRDFSERSRLPAGRVGLLFAALNCSRVIDESVIAIGGLCDTETEGFLRTELIDGVETGVES